MTYAEKRAALGGRLVTLTGIGPLVVLAAGIVLTTMGGAAWSLLIAASVLYMVFAWPLFYRNWPTGIRLDDDGVHIGAQKRRVRVMHQNQGAFEVPWRGVTDIRVVTDGRELKRIRTSPELFTLSNHWTKGRRITKCMLGVLTAPFMRAALVVELYPGDATFPESQPAWFFPNQIGRPFRDKLEGYPSATWIAPTRRPEALASYLRSRRAGPENGSRTSG
jgi:hypothetical protein